MNDLSLTKGKRNPSDLTVADMAQALQMDPHVVRYGLGSSQLKPMPDYFLESGEPAWYASTVGRLFMTFCPPREDEKADGNFRHFLGVLTERLEAIENNYEVRSK